MTKVEMQFNLKKPLDEPLMERIAKVHGLYGLFHVRVDQSLAGIRVEYDASRLTPAQVTAALQRAGIPAEPAGA